MQTTRQKLALGLTVTAIIAVSILALLGIPHLGSAARVAPNEAVRSTMARTGPWFAPLVAPASAGEAYAHSAAHVGPAAHYAGGWAAGSEASGQSYGSSGYRSMHHCGFMPRYNELRA